MNVKPGSGVPRPKIQLFTSDFIRNGKDSEFVYALLLWCFEAGFRSLSDRMPLVQIRRVRRIRLAL